MNKTRRKIARMPSKDGGPGGGVLFTVLAYCERTTMPLNTCEVPLSHLYPILSGDDPSPTSSGGWNYPCPPQTRSRTPGGESLFAVWAFYRLLAVPLPLWEVAFQNRTPNSGEDDQKKVPTGDTVSAYAALNTITISRARGVLFSVWACYGRVAMTVTIPEIPST